MQLRGEKNYIELRDENRLCRRAFLKSCSNKKVAHEAVAECVANVLTAFVRLFVL